MRILRFSFFALLIVTSSCLPKQQDHEEEIDALISQMTLEEKISQTYGQSMWTFGIDRLGIPPFKMADGPVGARDGNATAFPAPIAMASSWDTMLVRKIGEIIAKECKAKNLDYLLAPCVNISRLPIGGRNFESYGEDPYLAARMGVAYINGVQGEGVIASVKHFACNNQEYNRMYVDVQIDERTLREIYLPAFKAAVQEADVQTVMAAYNKINGSYCSENDSLLNMILKGEWGFDGLVISDWGAANSTIGCAKGGLDLEMPFGRYFGDSLLATIKRGELDESILDDKIRRQLRVKYWAGLFDKKEEAQRRDTFPEHSYLALEAARKGIILLKNSNKVLPLKMEDTKKIAVIGPNAAEARVGAGGSSLVNSTYKVSPLEGIKNITAGKAEVLYDLGQKLDEELIQMVDSSCLRPPRGIKGDYGLYGEYFDNIDLEGEPVVTRVDPKINFGFPEGKPHPSMEPDYYSVRWTGYLVPKESKSYTITVNSDDGIKVYINDQILIDNWGMHAAEERNADIYLVAGKYYKLKIEYFEGAAGAIVQFGWNYPTKEIKHTIPEAINIAKQSDAAVVCVGFSNAYDGEGSDRTREFNLPGVQEQLIEAVADANPNTIVVFNSGVPVILGEWANKVSAIIQAWYPGQEGGNALAEIIFGQVNPSAKLPVTSVKQYADIDIWDTYDTPDRTAPYKEGIFVGYRYFDHHNIEPEFPFGHGLSYTQFEYSDLNISNKENNYKVTFTVSNKGEYDGDEIAQLYVHDVKSSVVRPAKELKGFSRVSVKKGESEKVTITFNKRDLAFYDVKTSSWVTEPGEFEVLIGSSSRDIRLKQSINVE